MTDEDVLTTLQEYSAKSTSPARRRVLLGSLLAEVVERNSKIDLERRKLSRLAERIAEETRKI